MALRKNNPDTSTEQPNPTTPAAGAFEGMDDAPTTVADAEKPAANDTPAASKTEQKASLGALVAKATNAVVALPTETAISALKDVIPLSDIEAMGFGTFPRITVNTGGFSKDKQDSLGSRIKFNILSWNYAWIVTTGAKDNKEADKLIRSSYDGVNLAGGEGTVVDYVKRLKEVENYKDATTKQYVEIYGQLVGFEQIDPKTRQLVQVEVPEEDQELMQISVSPQSVKQWGRFQLEERLRKAKGIDGSSLVVMTANKKTINSNEFGLINFSKN